MRCCCCAKKTSQELWRIKIIRQTAQVWRIATQTFMPWWVLCWFSGQLFLIFRNGLYFFLLQYLGQWWWFRRGCSRGAHWPAGVCHPLRNNNLHYRSWDHPLPHPSLARNLTLLSIGSRNVGAAGQTQLFVVIAAEALQISYRNLTWMQPHENMLKPDIELFIISNVLHYDVIFHS